MSIEVPGTIFAQFHSGWKFIAAHVEGAGLRFCIESPAKGMFLSFRIEKQNEQKLYDCLRQSHRDETESGLPEKERMAADDLSEGRAS